MNITPKVVEGADDELVFCERGKAESHSLSNGFESSPQKNLNQVRQKLFHLLLVLKVFTSNYLN